MDEQEFPVWRDLNGNETVMDEKAIQQWKDRIDEMSHEQMARMWRFHVAGITPIFDSALPLWPYFEARWNNFGGWNPTLSKKIGWD